MNTWAIDTIKYVDNKIKIYTYYDRFSYKN